jgi:hypothetical protein
MPSLPPPTRDQLDGLIIDEPALTPLIQINAAGFIPTDCSPSFCGDRQRRSQM